MSAEDNPNYAILRDCLSTTLLRSTSTAPEPKRRRRAKSAAAPSSAPAPDQAKDMEELAEFIDYLATEIFECLPQELQELDYRTWRESNRLQTQYSLPLTDGNLSTLDLTPSIPDTLRTYKLISPDPTLDSPLPATTEIYLAPILSSYLSTVTTPPPATTASRTEACELCDRSWINLTYHHLIPRFAHEKAIKRGWHRKEDLQNVAWLCGACHRFVHHFKTHEELARDYYTIELLLEEEEVRKWTAWVGKLRWKGGSMRSGVGR